MTQTVEGVVLAAGQGTRMNSDKPKVCHECFGEAMITHIIRGLNRTNIGTVTTVVGEGREQVEALLPEDVTSVLQEDQLGTGHAVQQVFDADGLTEASGLLITCGDIPGVRPSTYERLVDAYQSSDADLVLLTTTVDDPEGYGRVKLGEDGAVAAIVEEVDATPEEAAIDRINTGIMCGSVSVFERFLPQLENDNEAGEYYLTDVIAMMNDNDMNVDFVEVEDSWEVTGINTRRQLVDFERDGYRRRVEKLLENGVTVHDPERVKIGPWVDVSDDVEIEGGLFAYGTSTIDSNVRIYGESRIVDTTVGAGTTVQSSTLKSSEIGEDVTIGPYAHLRPGAKISEDVKIGNFVEVKNSTIGPGTSVSHLSYLGDAEFGANVNVGAGTITCNYDGDDKHKTIVEDDVFIGSNVEIVAPAHIGEGATLGAGSTVTKDVPANSLGIGRERQKNIDDWNS